MDIKQAKRILLDAKWKAVAVAGESPAMGAAMLAEIKAMERELAIEMAAPHDARCLKCGRLLANEHEDLPACNLCIMFDDALESYEE